ncbi:MAG: hypothetical protein ABSF28_01885 [Terracidiphilus sp.]|jgi:hypothetical protein
MLKYLLAFSLAIPMDGHSQSYTDSPFYRLAPGIPSTAQVEGYAHGSIKANGVVIDLSDSVPRPSPDFNEIQDWSLGAFVDRNRPAHIFHFLIQYDHLNVAFGYDLLVTPVEGTDQIKCTFSALTDPEDPMLFRNKDIPLVALPPDLTPIVIKSGDALSFTTLPLGEGKIEVVHYLRLTRLDLAFASGQ